MITKPCAVALEWWLKGQGKFDGADVRTSSVDGLVYTIDTWNVDGVAKPTDEQVMDIVALWDASPEAALLRARL